MVMRWAACPEITDDIAKTVVASLVESRLDYAANLVLPTS